MAVLQLAAHPACLCCSLQPTQPACAALWDFGVAVLQSIPGCLLCILTPLHFLTRLYVEAKPHSQGVYASCCCTLHSVHCGLLLRSCLG